MVERNQNNNSLAVAAGQKKTFITDVFRKPNLDPGVFRMRAVCVVLGCTIDELFQKDSGPREHINFVSKNLKIAMEGKMVSAESLAEEFGVPVEHFGAGFGGTGYPDIYALTKFATEYGVSMDWFFRAAEAGVPSEWVARSGQQKPGKSAAQKAPAPQVRVDEKLAP